MGLLTSLFALLGYSKVLPESLMDSVTACSGSGIAYVSVCVNAHKRTRGKCFLVNKVRKSTFIPHCCKFLSG